MCVQCATLEISHISSNEGKDLRLRDIVLWASRPLLISLCTSIIYSLL